MNYNVKTAQEMRDHCLRGREVEVEVEDLCRVGWISIEYVDEENVYFVALETNTRHFCKIEGLGVIHSWRA